MKWSYKTVHFELKKEGLLGGAFLDETEIEEQLNDFGRSGWDLVSVIEVQDGIIAFFKQPLTFRTAATSSPREISSSAEWEYEGAEDHRQFETENRYAEELEAEEVEDQRRFETDESYAQEELEEYSDHEDDPLGVEAGEYEEPAEQMVEDEIAEEDWEDQQVEHYRDYEETQEEEPEDLDEQPHNKGIGAIRIE